MPKGDKEPAPIDARPTKELFIEMLTRDITLMPAICDLADNAVDGAQRLRGGGNYDGLWLKIHLSPDEFKIEDNCGGIPLEIAQKYAFRFGRPSEAPRLKHSVGRFGVGMKRALFKLGREFAIESAAKGTRFLLAVDVDNWKGLPDTWEFKFTSVERQPIPTHERGTTIRVTRLHSESATAFGPGHFLSQLKNEVQARLKYAMAKGMRVTINDTPVEEEPLTILSDPRLKPAMKELTLLGNSKNPVKVRLFCGLGKSDERAAAGWHVFCNHRLILEGEKSELTGWGQALAGVSIPAFHGQYNHFRGFAYFDSDDAGQLPWNTTKTSLNTDSPVYRATLPQMIQLMRPVIDFLNVLKEEKEREPDSSGVLAEMMKASETADLESITARHKFEAPKVKLPKPNPEMQRIQYYRPAAEVERVKEVLDVASFKAVGEKTFDYFLKAECR